MIQACQRYIIDGWLRTKQLRVGSRPNLVFRITIGRGVRLIGEKAHDLVIEKGCVG